MSTDNITEIVKKVRTSRPAGNRWRRKLLLRRRPVRQSLRRSDLEQPLRPGRNRPTARDRRAGQSRMRPIPPRSPAESGRNRARPRIGRRHRRASVRAPCRPHGQGLWPGHDGRDARPRGREQAQSRSGERRVPEGQIESIPLPGNSVDVIISNCVINLSANKDRVLAEAFRVLKPGGRLAVSDVVTKGEMLPQIRKNVLLWVGCVAGALEENEYRAKLAAPASSRSMWNPRASTASTTLASSCPARNRCGSLAAEVDGKF